MHTGVILLTKAESPMEARENVNEFMEGYGDDVWDWWQVGGRWSGTLDGYDPYSDEANKKDCWLCDSTGMRNDELGKQSRKEDPDYKCNGCNGTGKMDKWPTDFGDRDGDAMPLSSCIEKVEDWQQTLDDAKKAQEDAKKWLKGGDRTKKMKEDKDDWNMYGYCLRRAGKLFSQHFCFDCNIYNIGSWDYAIPEDKQGWFAVIIDMHN